MLCYEFGINLIPMHLHLYVYLLSPALSNKIHGCKHNAIKKKKWTHSSTVSRLSLRIVFYISAMRARCSHMVFAAILWTMPCTTAAVVVTNTTELFPITMPEFGIKLNWRNSSDVPHSRRKRYISSRDMMALLEHHNLVRSQVFPPAANMEYMVMRLLMKCFRQCFQKSFLKSRCFLFGKVWNEKLARSAESWASQCIWDHGPSHVMRYMGQNLSITTGRYENLAGVN